MNHLVEPAELAELLNANPGIIVVHVANPDAYAAGHIGGALHVAPAELVAGGKPAPGLLPPQRELERLFSRIGYRRDATIVAYDDEGGGWAGRFIWTLDVIGHRDWRYLNGGIHAWAAAGLPLQRTPAHATPTDVHLTLDRGPTVSADEIIERLNDASLVIWDCRSAEEYRGTRVTAARNGHIPGAVHLDWLDLMDPGRALRLRGDLDTLLAARGITHDKDVIVHCQTHHRSGLAYLVGRLLGYPSIRAYAGSWSEWGNRDDTPIETAG